MLHRFVLTCLVALVLNGLIALWGPALRWEGHYPLESWAARIAWMTGLTLVMLLPWAWKALRMRRARQALHRGLTEGEERAQAQEHLIQTSFDTALRTLAQHRITPQGWRKWLPRKLNVYELPWYVLIGPPGAGKTTALHNAGLRFPLQAEGGKGSVAGAGGTRHCEWWFSDQAVLIDTAGRLTTQDSDSQADAAGWMKFLRLLARHRPRQPLNGVVLVLSLSDLQSRGQARELLLGRIRLRLQEVIRELGLCPPVYCLITKMDKLSGFQASFDGLSKEDASQPWGVNLQFGQPLEQELTQTMPQKFQRLVKQLKSLTVQKLELEPALNKRQALFEFQDNLAKFVQTLSDWNQDLFGGDSVFEHPVHLRGVYLCSGLQDGSGLDRLINEHAQWGATVQQSGSRAYFIEGFVQEVLLAERDVVGWVNRVLQRTRGWWWAATLGSLTLGLGLSAGLLHSHANNLKLSQQAQTEALALMSQAAPWTPKTLQLNIELLQWLERASEVDQVKALGAEHWTFGWGLSQAAKLQQVSMSSQQQHLNAALWPLWIKQLELGLDHALRSTDGQAYNSLKAYLMPSHPQHFNAAWLLQHSQQVVQGPAFESWTDSQRQLLLTHLESAMHSGSPAQLPQSSAALVSKARQQLAQTPLEQRILQSLQSEVDLAQINRFDVLQAAGSELAGLVQRASGQPLQSGPEGLYTLAGFRQVVVPKLPQVLAQLQQEAQWVMGESGDALAGDALNRRIRLAYAETYIRQWDGFLRDLKARPFADLQSAIDTARIMATPNSPLKRLLKSISKETRLTGLDDADTQKLADEAANSATRRLGGAVGEIAKGAVKRQLLDQDLIEKRVDDHFRNIHRLFNEGDTAFREVETLMTDVYNRLSATGAAQRGQALPPDPQQFAELIQRAGLQAQPIPPLVAQLAVLGTQKGESARKASLSAQLQPASDQCQKLTAGRYPFLAGANLDVLPADFARLFSPQGLLAQSFDQNLRAEIDTRSPQWQLKSASGNGAVSSAAVAQYQRAQRLTDTYFAQGGRLGFQVELRWASGSPTTDVLKFEYDGRTQQLEPGSDQRITLNWPAQNASGTFQVRLGNEAGLSFKGPWALFRFLDASLVRPGRGAEQLLVSFQLQGRRVDLELNTPSALNPLRIQELRQFRCPGNV